MNHHTLRVREPLPEDAVAVRLSTLQIIGFAALAMGLTIAIRQPAPGVGVSLFTLLPGWPGLYGLILAAAGLALMSGAWVRRPLLTLLGAWGAMAWFFSFGAGFVLSWANWRWNDTLGPEPPLFPGWAYMALALVLWAQSDVILRTREVERLM